MKKESWLEISLLSIIFINTRKFKSTPIPILFLIQLIYHSLYKSYFLTPPSSWSIYIIHAQHVTNNSLWQIKSTFILLSGLVRRSANWCHDATCFVTVIFASNFLRTIWLSTSMCLVLSWNTSFSAMCIVVLSHHIVSWDILGENQSLQINLWFISALISHLLSPCTLTLQWTERPHSTSYFSMTQDFLQEKIILWSTSYQKNTLPILQRRSLLFGCVHDLNKSPLPGASFRFLKILISASKWVVLDVDKNWLTVLTTNVMFSLVIIGSLVSPPIYCISQHPQEAPTIR